MKVLVLKKEIRVNELQDRGQEMLRLLFLS